ncbi:MAG TPA: hemolysin III family protein [Noviherbaspirillum sp.]|uniref:PAQR family membrane homeostasis protein TrhA n=1 Tax=Noviherbaspirillum sp. TaxID=1926288 RepID=UPI002B466F38|nr:hemolysin III family protein [Noviherbaspirillum sp.]HJV87453.1 hemolysin III family protein [Noviherbaspirillum sp.]
MYYGERFNSFSHLAGAVLAACGTTLLIVMAAHAGDPWKIVSFSIYGTMLFALYVVSTLYHSLRGTAKDVLRKLDHCAIYLLIAGTYTPFTLVTLRGPLGWALFGTIWGLAVIGIVQELCIAKGARVLSIVIYVLMGWMALLAVVPLISALSWSGFGWLAAGGAAYTFGLVFYVRDERMVHGHGIWHLFVLGGSACHYLAILLHVV